MKIYVVGSCQGIPLANCLAVMLPQIPVERFLPRADLSALVTAEDVVFRQRESREMTQARSAGGEIVYPRIWFNAFHPDVVYVKGPWGAVQPPLGGDHSSLVLYGWHRRLSVAETARLFTEPVFERLRFFDCWDASTQTLLKEGEEIGFPLGAILARLTQHGCFMRSPNHPALIVMAEIARELVRRAELPAALGSPECYVADPLLALSVWPVYPEIGARLGLPGAYAFKTAQGAHLTTPVLLDLEEFIARSFEAYATMSPSALACARLDDPAYRDLEHLAAGARRTPRNAASPYADLPDQRFWRRAVERVPPAQVDPVSAPPFPIERGSRIAIVGSTFAQRIADALAQQGYDPFSAPAGEVHTARQLLQLFDRAFGTFVPGAGAWLREDGRYADPFRPRAEPDGFGSPGEMEASRAGHLAAVRTMFEEVEVLVFVLGLTEAWRAKADGAVFPLAPGVAAGRLDPAEHEFVNFTAAEVRDDVEALLARLGAVNPRARLVLTVSPQPPVVTYEPRHVLVSAAYTKAALRVAAEEIARAHPDVWYFPGYEVVAGSFTRGAYYERDLRTVTSEGVEHVMRLLRAHCGAAERVPSAHDAHVLREYLENVEVVCDEEAIEDGAAGSPGAAAVPPPEWAEFGWFRDFEAPVVPEDDTLQTADRMEPLAPASMRAELAVALPAAMRAGSIVSLPCGVRNDGDAVLATGKQHPVYLCYRWLDAAGQLTEIGRSIHTALPRAIEPGAALELKLRIAAPQYEGRYRLRVSLLQSEVAWFDDVDPANGAEAWIDVAANAAAVVAS